ncbi:unnamed protein product [Prorocentrum cordatum]|uniref:Glutathione peroxidase n=1 Tax=Prorocentrum cordatum TaxID=2364126 RepID=A0ABN9XIP4_9DINO|nr:unnamed protein product [Polarella glacialis]
MTWRWVGRPSISLLVPAGPPLSLPLRASLPLPLPPQKHVFASLQPFSGPPFCGAQGRRAPAGAETRRMARRLCLSAAAFTAAATASPGPSLYDLTVTGIAGDALPLNSLRGNVTVLINVATY